ncbi:uncharacterized protein LOC119726845 [Patiria miniata]|uniref:G-protein coupled receptors family 1 profile domain-containing protein n=1 Tax=Patiria miniata TaxID=46514 RepID=A0A913ZS85_PATMI|nr:uncharacterized protein LOC119726845 [Patiria miniata]
MNETPNETTTWSTSTDQVAVTRTNQTWASEVPALWAVSPGEVALRVTLLLAICGVGVTFNLLNGLMLLKSKRPTTTMHLLMFNLVVVDLTMSLTCIPLSVFFSASNGAVQVPDELCKASAYLLQTLIIASLLTQSAISVIRTVAITLPEALKRRLPPATTCKIIAFVWIQASLTPMLPFLSHDHVVNDLFTYQPRLMAYAISDGHTKTPQALLFSVMGYLLPLTIICISYVTLYVSLRRHLKKNFLVQDRGSRHMYTVQMRVQVKVGCLVIFVISSTILIWIPFYIMSSLSLFEAAQFESLSRNASAVLIFGASSVNPVMYGFMNTSLRQEFKAYLSAKHPKILKLLGKMKCCRCCCKKKAKVDAVIVIPREQIQRSIGNNECEPGSISGQLVLQINHEISLKQQSVFSIKHPLEFPETNAAQHQHTDAPTGGRGAVPPLLKRCSWSQSLAHNARRFSDKVSRRRSGSDSTTDGRRQLPLLDFNAVSQLREESQGLGTMDSRHLPRTHRQSNPESVFQQPTDDTKTKYNKTRNPLTPNAKDPSSGYKDGSVVAVSRCFKKQPVFGDIVKVRRVFIEEVTLVSGNYAGSVVGETDQGAGHPRTSLSCHRESVSSADSQLVTTTTLKASEDVYATMTVQLPGCIQAIHEK